MLQQNKENVLECLLSPIEMGRLKKQHPFV